MTQTTIYLSITCGEDSLILDGNLYLLKELITMLKKTVNESQEVKFDMNSQEHRDEADGPK